MPTLTFYLKLIGTNPLVTRTFKVSSESSMYVLNHIIHVVMGWKNYHLYQFEVGAMVIADKRLWEEDGMGPVTDVKDVSVGEVFTKVGTTAVYELAKSKYPIIKCTMLFLTFYLTIIELALIQNILLELSLIKFLFQLKMNFF